VLRWADRELDEAVGEESDRSRWQQRPHLPSRQFQRFPHGRAAVVSDRDHQAGDVGKATDRPDSTSSLKRFVTFYITHFQPQATLFFLRKGFEVCGILEDLFVAKNRNRNGEVYGFVRFAKVRDVDKLLKGLNNVCFGHYCVRVVLARFDRKGERKGVTMREGEGVGGKFGGERAGEVAKVREEEAEGEKSKAGVLGEGVVGTKKEKVGEGGVRVGSVMVRVGVSTEKEGDGEGDERVADRVIGKAGRKASTDMSKGQTRLVRKYRSFNEDLKWASRGLTGTVMDGAPIHVIQNRVVDAGFKDIDIIPLGADKVFVHSLNDLNISEVV